MVYKLNKGEKKYITTVILLFLAVFLPVAIYSMDIPPGCASADNAENLMCAYNLTHYGIYSHVTGIVAGRHEPPKPDAYREPVYPLFLSLGMLIYPPYRNLEPQDFLVEEGSATTNLTVRLPSKLLGFFDLALLLVCAFLAALIIYRKTENARFSAYSLFFIGLSPRLIKYVGGFYSEIFTAVLILGLSLSLYFLIEKQKPINYCISGLFLGILTLTKAVFQYAFVPMILLLLIYHIFKKTRPRTILVTTLVFLLSFGAVVTPWVARNYSHFHRFYITDRGGGVLHYRARYLDMTPKLYLASFVWFSDRDIAKKLKPLFSKDVHDYFDARLSKDFNVKKKAVRWDMLKTLNYDYSKRDTYLMNSALDDIKGRPFRFLLLSIPFAWRGLFVGELGIVSLVIFGCFFIAIIRAIRKREWAWAAFFFIPLYLYGMNSLFTHNLNRYNRPIIPILWIAFFFLLEPVCRNVEKRLVESPRVRKIFT